MDKKIFSVYLAKAGDLNSDACATLELPASPWEVQDALDKVRLKEGKELYLEIDDYHDLHCLMPHLSDTDISLNELNNLAQRIADLEHGQRFLFRALLQMKVQEHTQQNSGALTMQDLRDCAVSAACDDYQLVDAADDEALGRFYAEGDFLSALDGISDEVFRLLDFAKIGREMRALECGAFVGGGYVLWEGEWQTAPPCPRELPPKLDYLFRLKLGLHPDFGGARQTTLTLPATEEELDAAQVELGTANWENTVLLDYDGIIPNVAYFADLPAELEAFNEFAGSVGGIPQKQIPTLKALLDHLEVTKLEDAIALSENLDSYVLTGTISSPADMAVEHIRFLAGSENADLISKHLNLYAYGQAVIQQNNAILSPYGLLHRADFQPMLNPVQESVEMHMQ